MQSIVGFDLALLGLALTSSSHQKQALSFMLKREQGLHMDGTQCKVWKEVYDETNDTKT